MSSYIISSELRIEGTGIAPGRVKLDDGTNELELTAPTTLSSNISFNLPDDTGTSGQALITDGNNPASLTWSNSSIPFSSQTANTTVSTTSSTYVLIPSMTITPVAGTYKITFSSSGNLTGTNDIGNYAIHIGGTIIQNTERFLTTGFVFGGPTATALHTQTIQTVTGSDVIDVRYQVSAGSFNVYERSLILEKLT